MKRILVIQTASIGDVILATPVVEKLHRFFPGALIDLLVKKGNESLFSDHPYLHEVLTWDKRSGKLRNAGNLLHRVRQAHYDVVVNLQRFFMTGLLTAFSGAGIRIGFDKNPLSALFTHKIKHQIGEGMHEIRRNLSLIEGITDKREALPRLFPSTGDYMFVSRLKTRQYYTISPASLWFTKQYPSEKWVEMIRLIPGGANVYLLGSANDRELCNEIIAKAMHPGAKSLAGNLTFLQSAALMKDARMNFTNDSAPMHLSSAVNAPVTVIYCSTVPRFGFGPLSEDSMVVETGENLSCRPCGLHGYQSCPERHFRCALTIDTKKLIDRL